MNELKLTKTMLDSAKSTAALFEIEPFKNNFVTNYEKTTGKTNGSVIFERERVLFLEKVTQNPAIEKCDNFSKYRALIQLAASGLTLQGDQAYIIPKGGKVTFQIGWKGRLQQIGLIPSVLFVSPAQVVYEGDDFELELGENPTVKHIQCKRSERVKLPKEEHGGKYVISHVYMYVQFRHGKELYIMDRDEVLNIRNLRSDSYKYWSQNTNSKKPMWITDEPQAFRKTLVKRAWNQIADIGHLTSTMTDLETQIKGNPSPEDDGKVDYGIEEETQDITHEEITEDNGATPY